MSNSRKLNIWRDIDKESSNNNLDNSNILNLSIKKNYDLDCIIPKLNLPVGCDNYINKILLYKSENKNNNSLLDNSNNGKKKIGLSELSLDIQKILKDAKELVDKEFSKKCFGQVFYDKNTKKLDFYSENDVNKIQILGEVDLSETIEEVENKIPIILINDDTLEIKLEL